MATVLFTMCCKQQLVCNCNVWWYRTSLMLINNIVCNHSLQLIHDDSFICVSRSYTLIYLITFIGGFWSLSWACLCIDKWCVSNIPDCMVLYCVRKPEIQVENHTDTGQTQQQDPGDQNYASYSLARWLPWDGSVLVSWVFLCMDEKCLLGLNWVPSETTELMKLNLKSRTLHGHIELWFFSFAFVLCADSNWLNTILFGINT